MSRFAILSALVFTMAVSLHGTDSSVAESTEVENSFPKTGILPKEETGSARFIEQHPEADGRGTIVAIFDSGVDPAAVDLQTTSDGKPKVIDIIDATGSGDVMMNTVQKPNEGTLTGLSGRKLTIHPDWKAKGGDYRLGLKPAFDLFPGELVQRLKSDRKQAMTIRERAVVNALQDQIATFKAAKGKPSLAELKARKALLEKLVSSFDDPGPMLDCVVFHDGTDWRAVIDTDEDGDLRDERAMTNYRKNREYTMFSEASKLSFSVNIFENGKRLSIVTVAGEHGTHVAGIVAAHNPDHPERNGVAPGAQIVAVKIGDTRLDGMETGAALVRGLQAVRESGCDLINMSYGEPSSTANKGRLVEQFNELVREHGTIFVASAGNSGPALSTVGAPGGTSTGIIGVGAYASPQMAAVEYSSRDPLPGLPYTWTSRGPTADGDTGVDLFAPGGAITNIPLYSQQSHRRMNGTSMASPNACGNIAVLLSALKQHNLDYTPASVLRSLQNTAEVIDDAGHLAQGPGLVQIDRAFEHFRENQADADLQYELEVSVRSRNGRGIYLREAYEMEQPWSGTVAVKPYFPKGTSNDSRIAFELPIRLEATEDWVDVGEHLLLSQGGNSFDVQVDPTEIDPGLHTAEVLGFSTEHPELGPVFRVPVTVTKPHYIEDGRFETELESEAGSVRRTFLSVPDWATKATVRVRRHEGDSYRVFYVHAVQLVPGASFEEHEYKKTVGLSGDEESEHEFNVLPGRTIEVCLAQYWSNLGESELEIEVEFHGLNISEKSIALPSSAEATVVTVQGRERVQVLKPTASLTKQSRTLLPKSSTVKVLADARDALPENQRTVSLQLNYELNVASRVSQKLIPTPLRDRLYDAPVDSIRMFIFDQHNRLVSTRDMFADAVTLDKGKYNVEIELRHSSASALNRYKAMPLTVERSLSAISIPIARTRVAANSGRSDFGTEELAHDEQATLWMAYPFERGLPSGTQNGDVFSGTLKLNDDGLSVPMSFAVSHAKVASTAALTASQQSDLKAAERAFLLKQLTAYKWSNDREAIDQITERLSELEVDRLKLLTARLQLIDDDDRKECLDDVVNAANAVIKITKAKRLQTYFGIRQRPSTAEERKVQKQREAEKKALIDALYRKGRALAYKELPDVVAKHAIVDQKQLDEDFKQNFDALANWVDILSNDYFLLEVRRLRRDGNQAQAIAVLNRFFKANDHQKLHHKKRRDMYKEIGWQQWYDYEQSWMLKKFPKDRVPF